MFGTPEGNDAYLHNLDAVIQKLREARIELDKSDELIRELDERSLEITHADVDLSCVKPFDDGGIVYALGEMRDFLGIDEADIYMMENAELQEGIRTIVSSYRTVVLNILTGIKPHFTTASAISSEVGFVRVFPYELIEAMVREEVIEVIDEKTYPTMLRTYFDAKLDDVVFRIHNMWAPMFDDNTHKQLARQFLRSDIDEQKLRDTFKAMKEPVFRKSRLDRHV